MSLPKFAMLFHTYYQKEQNESKESINQDNDDILTKTRRQLITLTDNSKMVVRNIPTVFRVPYFVASTNPEHFYYSLLVQYMPYPSETELLEGFDNARNAFLAREEELKVINSYMEQHRERDRQLKTAFNQVHAYQILEKPPELENIENYEELPEQAMTNNTGLQKKWSASGVGVYFPYVFFDSEFESIFSFAPARQDF